MSHHVKAMLQAYPGEPSGMDLDKLAACIAACYECAQTCTSCADACLGEKMVAELTKCIRADLDCADVCAATGKVLTRQTGNEALISRAMLEACALACSGCAQECEQHAQMHDHCRICAEACRRCEAACKELLATLG
jgi:hypothetical protein